MRVEKGPWWKLQEHLGPGSTPRSAAPRIPQKDTFAAKGSYTPAGILFVPYRECALGARETRKTHVPGGAPRAASRALRWRRPPEATPHPAARPTASPSLPGDAPRRASSQEAPGAGDPARLSGRCVRLRPPGPASSPRPRPARGTPRRVLARARPSASEFPRSQVPGRAAETDAEPSGKTRRRRPPSGQEPRGGRGAGRRRRAEERAGSQRPAAAALRGAQPHPRGTAPPPPPRPHEGRHPSPAAHPRLPVPGPKHRAPSPSAVLPASPARGSRPTRAPAPNPAQSPPAAAAPFV